MHVKHLTRNGTRVVVQPSNVRICTDQEYKDAGAEISEDLSECNVILGVKVCMVCVCVCVCVVCV